MHQGSIGFEKTERGECGRGGGKGDPGAGAQGPELHDHEERVCVTADVPRHFDSRLSLCCARAAVIMQQTSTSLGA